MRKRAQSNSAGPEPVLVDTKGAMRMLSLGRSSIVAMADRGELTRVHPAGAGSRAVRFSTEEITDLVLRRRSEGRSASAREMGLFRLSPSDPAE
jgi:hypothetical protein